MTGVHPDSANDGDVKPTATCAESDRSTSTPAESVAEPVIGPMEAPAWMTISGPTFETPSGIEIPSMGIVPSDTKGEEILFSKLASMCNSGVTLADTPCGVRLNEKLTATE